MDHRQSGRRVLSTAFMLLKDRVCAHVIKKGNKRKSENQRFWGREQRVQLIFKASLKVRLQSLGQRFNCDHLVLLLSKELCEAFLLFVLVRGNDDGRDEMNHTLLDRDIRHGDGDVPVEDDPRKAVEVANVDAQILLVQESGEVDLHIPSSQRQHEYRDTAFDVKLRT
jgi:hypothetical protein